MPVQVSWQDKVAELYAMAWQICHITISGGPSGWSGWSTDHPVDHPSTIHNINKIFLKKQAVRRSVPFVFATNAVTRSGFPPVRVQLGRPSSKSIEGRLDSASPGLPPIPLSLDCRHRRISIARRFAWPGALDCRHCLQDWSPVLS
jgi:hypothetical protein